MFAHIPIVRDIIYGAVSKGASLKDLCEALSIDPSDLNDSEMKVDFRRAYSAWTLAEEMTGDPLLGLHLGEMTNPSILGLLGHLMQSSPNLLEAFRNVCKFSELATDMFTYRIKEQGHTILLQYKAATHWTNVSNASARHATDQAMAGTLQVFYLLSGHRVYPMATSFTFRKQSVSEYERIFRSPVKFNEAVNQLTFSRSSLVAPVISYDRSLLSVFTKMLQDRKLKGSDTITGDLRRVIMHDFKGQIPGIEILASHLHLTVRSLQRRLTNEKTTFRKFTSQVKSELSRQLLSAKGSKVSQVSSLMGYSDPRAFRRAFKAWTGTAPRTQK